VIYFEAQKYITYETKLLEMTQCGADVMKQRSVAFHDVTGHLAGRRDGFKGTEHLYLAPDNSTVLNEA
jgi:hypothetical protein